MRLPNLTQTNSGHVRIILATGLILFVLAGAGLSVFFLTGKSTAKTARQQEIFARSLREYDTRLTETTGTERDFTMLNRELDRLERTAISVESWLSVLKRRRALARLHPPFVENYRKSVNNASEAYPMSQPVAAIAAGTLIKDTAVNREAEEKLRGWLPLFTDSAFNTLRLGLHVILGDFKNPERAQVIPYSVFSDGTEGITIDLTILKIIRDSIPIAAADIQTILHSPSPSADSLRLAAEFYYDFGDLERSAEIFSSIGDEKARIREADALYLAGYHDSARSIWSVLADNNPPNKRSLYNLGVTAEESLKAAAWFEKLVNIDAVTNADSSSAPAERQFGLVRYSRLLDFPQAIAALESTEGLNPSLYPFVDLELCRRQSERRELGRQLAETWLLLDRHDENEDLYQWAAWLFLFQRSFNETKILLNRMDNLQFTQPWAEVTRAVQLMIDGDIETAEDILISIPVEDAQWIVYANLGRVLEAERSHGRALEQYEIAASKTKNQKTAAKIHLRMAKCFSALGRPLEALSALEYAMDLDPGNLTTRLELERIRGF